MDSINTLLVGLIAILVSALFYTQIQLSGLKSTVSQLKSQGSRVNKGKIKPEEAKIVDKLTKDSIIKETTSFCRCWKSSTFPYCDASHNNHNKECGDNVGPLVIQNPAAAAATTAAK